MAAALAAFLLLLSLTALGSPPPAARRAAGPPARPVYPGASGHLLLAVPARISGGTTGPNPVEQLYALDLADRSLQEGPVIPPAAGPPDFEPFDIPRSLSVGPTGTPASGRAAFLSQGAGATFLYVVPTARGLTPEAAAAAEAVGYAWTASGALAIARPVGVDRIDVSVADPSTGAETAVGTLRRRFPSVPTLFATGEDLYAVRGTDGAVIRVADGRRLLRGRFVLSTAPAGSGEVLVARQVFEPGLGRTRGFAVWTPGSRPEAVRYPFVPERILGWTADGGRYAATGWYDGRPGLWVLRSIGSGPAVLVMALDLPPLGQEGAGADIPALAFAGDGRAVFYVEGLGIHGFDLVRQGPFEVPLPRSFGRIPSDLAWTP